MLTNVRRALVVGVLSAVAAGLCAPGAMAAPPSPANPAGKILGVVPAHGNATKSSFSSGNLSYHNGPVMHTNTVHAIYWVPSGYSVSLEYQSTIDTYFGNVAGTNGQTSNVYFSGTQYYDLTGNVADNSTFAGSVLDTHPFPASGCRDSYTSVCLTDSQLQTEITRVMGDNGWAGGTSNMYFIFTPKDVGSCAGSSCAFSYCCAYHSRSGRARARRCTRTCPMRPGCPRRAGVGRARTVTMPTRPST